MWVLMPPTVPINHYGDSKNQQNRTARPILLFHANIFGRLACFEHSNFFKVKVLVPLPHKYDRSPRGKAQPDSTRREADRPSGPKIQLRAF